MFYHIRIQCKKPEHMLMLHCSVVIRIICRKHHNRALFVNVSKRLQEKTAPRADSLTPIPFAVKNAHAVCGGCLHHSQSLLHPRREEGTARAHLSWKHRVAGPVCSVRGNQLWQKANLRLLLTAIFEYPTVPSKQICNRHNIDIALWEIISFNWNLLWSLSSTVLNPLLHCCPATQAPEWPVHWSFPPWKLNMALGVPPQQCPASTHTGGEIVPSPFWRAPEGPEDSACWGAFSSDLGLSKEGMFGEKASPLF